MLSKTGSHQHLFWDWNALFHDSEPLKARQSAISTSLRVNLRLSTYDEKAVNRALVVEEAKVVVNNAGFVSLTIVKLEWYEEKLCP